MGVLQNALGLNLTDHDPVDHSLFSVGVDQYQPHPGPTTGFLELLDDGTAFLLFEGLDNQLLLLGE